MRRVLVDTNVLLSFLTDRNPEQQRQAAALLEAAASDEREVVLHQIVIAELVYVLRNVYGRPAIEIATILRDLLALPGVTTADALSWARLLDLWPAKLKDFTDAALAAVAVDEHVDAVATFDQTFRRGLRAVRQVEYFALSGSR